MSSVTVVALLKDQLALFWLARTEQERKFLAVGGVAVLATLVYVLFMAPALSGREKLRAQLPQLREEAARMQALAQEAGELARQPAPQVTPMTKESVAASLAARSLTPASLVISGDFAKLQLNGVSFAGLYAWLDAQRRESRIVAEDVGVTAGSAPGLVDAVITLRQNTGTASR
jgi:general secretion pathway protein M